MEGDEMTPHERLLGDAIRGDAMLFVRERAVEAASRVADPLLGRCRFKSTNRKGGVRPRPIRFWRRALDGAIPSPNRTTRV
jgi:hypothetical protein